ncbi:hypothetical protein L7F22_001048 [Adiantum nelumboides]|nr:hypothetical protein [Adiantum nelumboides]
MGSNDNALPVLGRSKEDEPKANTFVIPPYIIAEAMSSLHGSLDLRWSGPITPSEMLYVEQYVQARYPEYYGGAIGKDNLPDFLLWKGETSQVGRSGSSTPRDRRASPGFGGNRDYSPSFGNTPSELRKTQLNEPSRLRELLTKRALLPDTSISVPEMAARNRVLKFCGVSDDDYLVVFATSVQEAMRMVGEAYPFFKSNCYMSALEEKMDAIKEYAVHNEAKFIQAPASWLDLRIAGSQLSQHFRRKSKYTSKGLFAYPLEMNGARNTLHWVSEAQRGLWHVLLDCSDLVLGDNSLILNLHKPDFVLCSTYKFPNQPIKVTCLLVRRNSFFISPP